MKKITIVIVLLAIVGVIIYIVFLNDFINEKNNPSTNLDYETKTLKEENKNEEEDDNMNDFTSKINVKINGNDFTVTLEDNKTSRELINRLPLSITMNELNGNEKYYYFDEALPSNSESVGKINKGDVMLYGNDCLVIFYDTFNTSYSYTKIGKIDNSNNLDEVVGDNSITVRITR